jgi:RND family efflux transporter MFP subunit
MKNTILPLSALLLSLLFLAACGAPSENDEAKLKRLVAQRATLEAEIAELQKTVNAGNGNLRIKIVGLDAVDAQNFRHYIDLQGKIEAENNVPVTSKMPGALTRVLVKNGDMVSKGQLLAQIDDNVMQRSLSEMELQLQTATDLFNRQKSLWDQKIGTEVQYIQAKNTKEGIEKTIATMKEQIGQNRIYAPISGSVDMVMLKVGQAISPGIPLCNIVNMGELKVVGQVPEAYSAKVRKGDQVVVYFPDMKKEIETRISYISKSISEMNRTFTVECKLPSGTDYRANMIAVLKIIDYQNAKAIVVPVNVIQRSESGEFILTAEKTGEKQAIVRKKTIEQGPNYNGYVEISKGLQVGDWIISSGYQDVNDGETIAF